jgi:hypothetical protein
LANFGESGSKISGLTPQTALPPLVKAIELVAKRSKRLVSDLELQAENLPAVLKRKDPKRMLNISAVPSKRAPHKSKNL